MVLHAASAERSYGAGSANDAYKGIGLLLALEGLLHEDASGTMASLGCPQAQPARTSHCLSPVLSLSLQSSKAVQGLTGLRNLGNTVSAYQGTWLHSPSSPSALLWAHLWGSGEPCPFASPLAHSHPDNSPLLMVLVEEGFPMLCTASSPSSAHPPQVSPCHCLPPSDSRCHGFFSSASPSAS